MGARERKGCMREDEVKSRRSRTGWAEVKKEQLIKTSLPKYVTKIGKRRPHTIANIRFRMYAIDVLIEAWS